jgi:NADPH:quinone reductase-like Zn-dependent oxidoreductase
VQAAGLSRADVLWRQGCYFEQPRFPAQLGYYDAAGVVEALGPEVTRLKVGDQVSTFPAVSLLDYTAHGETLVYPETALLLLCVGADHFVVAGRDDVQWAILELTGGLGAEVIYDAVAGPGLRRTAVGDKTTRPRHRLWIPWGHGLRNPDAPWRVLPAEPHGASQFPGFRFHGPSGAWPSGKG